MYSRFTPNRFPNRIIFIDSNRQPAVAKMDCFGCGRLESVLFKNDELCLACYYKWSSRQVEEFVKFRFGS